MVRVEDKKYNVLHWPMIRIVVDMTGEQAFSRLQSPSPSNLLSPRRGELDAEGFHETEPGIFISPAYSDSSSSPRGEEVG